VSSPSSTRSRGRTSARTTRPRTVSKPVSSKPSHTTPYQHRQPFHFHVPHVPHRPPAPVLCADACRCVRRPAQIERTSLTPRRRPPPRPPLQEDPCHPPTPHPQGGLREDREAEEEGHPLPRQE
jgi:hypothetical protein